MKPNITTIPQLRNVYYAAYAAFPTTGLKAGDLGYATDRLVLYRWDGAAWQPITIHSSSGLAANIPNAADLPDGSFYYETDTKLTKQVQAGAWVDITPSAATIVRKTADQTVNNSDSLVNDTHLLFPVAINEVWEATFLLMNISVSDTPSMKIGLTVPTNAVFYAYTVLAKTDGTGAVSPNLPRAGIPRSIDAETTQILNGIVKVIVVVGDTAGNVQLQFAQDTATVEDTTMKENSCIIANKIT